MNRKSVSLLAVAMLTAIATASAASTIQINEDFASNPSARWHVFGDASRFQWNGAAGKLQVEWDSSKPKSFFYLPLGQMLTRYESFTFEFDLVLDELMSENEPGKTGPMQIGIGLLNEAATNVSWSRAYYGSSPNVAEFNIYPSGYYPGWPLDSTISPSFVASSATNYAPNNMIEYYSEVPMAQVIHVSMHYDAELQKLTSVWTTNGVPVGIPHTMVLHNPSNSDFKAIDDFNVNMFSISSYESNPWDSVYGRGSVDNISITIPPAPPIAWLRGAMNNGQWNMTFRSRQSYTYALERFEQFGSAPVVVASGAGNGGNLTLTDQNPPASKAFYRVRANE